MFIVDAAITLPIALLGFVFLPGLPWNAQPSVVLTASVSPRISTFTYKLLYNLSLSRMSRQDVSLARSRMQSVGRKEAQPWTRDKLRRLFSSWQVYVLPVLYTLWNQSNVQSPFRYWLKSLSADPPPVPGLRFSITQINLSSSFKSDGPVPTRTHAAPVPIPATILLVCMSLSWAWLSDGPFRGRRWPFIFLGAALNVSSLTLSPRSSSLADQCTPSGLVRCRLAGAPTLPAHRPSLRALSSGQRRSELFTSLLRLRALLTATSVQEGSGPMILAWIGEITGGDVSASTGPVPLPPASLTRAIQQNEHRAIIVAAGNDLAYIVHAVAINVVW